MEFETVSQVAERLGLSVRRVRDFCADGRLKAEKVGRTWFIEPDQTAPAVLSNKPQGKVKIRGIKKAVGDFNGWHDAARIYFNVVDLEVWTVIYTSGESFERPHLDVIEVASKTALFQHRNTITMKELQRLCEDEL